MVCKPTDPCYVYQGKLNTMSPSIVAVGSITSDISTPRGPQLVKRSKGDAIIRAEDKLSKVNRTLRGIPIVRPYVLGLNLLTYGLILVDPLDRLE